MYKTTRLQHASLFAHGSQVDQYVLRIHTAQGLPAGIPSIQAAIDYVTNVNLDGLGTWEVVGCRDKEVLFQRTIHQIEVSRVTKRVSDEGDPEYGFETKEGFTRVFPVNFQGVTDKDAHALKTALSALNALGWGLDSMIDPWKAPPAAFSVWRPLGRAAR